MILIRLGLLLVVELLQLMMVGCRQGSVTNKFEIVGKPVVAIIEPTTYTYTVSTTGNLGGCDEFHLLEQSLSL